MTTSAWLWTVLYFALGGTAGVFGFSCFWIPTVIWLLIEDEDLPESMSLFRGNTTE